MSFYHSQLHPKLSTTQTQPSPTKLSKYQKRCFQIKNIHQAPINAVQKIKEAPLQISEAITTTNIHTKIRLQKRKSKMVQNHIYFSDTDRRKLKNYKMNIEKFSIDSTAQASLYENPSKHSLVSTKEISHNFIANEKQNECCNWTHLTQRFNFKNLKDHHASVNRRDQEDESKIQIEIKRFEGVKTMMETCRLPSKKSCYLIRKPNQVKSKKTLQVEGSIKLLNKTCALRDNLFSKQKSESFLSPWVNELHDEDPYL